MDQIEIRHCGEVRFRDLPIGQIALDATYNDIAGVWSSGPAPDDDEAFEDRYLEAKEAISEACDLLATGKLAEAIEVLRGAL